MVKTSGNQMHDSLTDTMAATVSVIQFQEPILFCTHTDSAIIHRIYFHIHFHNVLVFSETLWVPLPLMTGYLTCILKILSNLHKKLPSFIDMNLEFWNKISIIYF